jgi:putative transposase
MTTQTMDPQSPREKTTDPDFLRHMIGFNAQRLMELEVEAQTGAALGERAPEGDPHDTVSHANDHRVR